MATISHRHAEKHGSSGSSCMQFPLPGRGIAGSRAGWHQHVFMRLNAGKATLIAHKASALNLASSQLGSTRPLLSTSLLASQVGLLPTAHPSRATDLAALHSATFQAFEGTAVVSHETDPRTATYHTSCLILLLSVRRLPSD